MDVRCSGRIVSVAIRRVGLRDFRPLGADGEWGRAEFPERNGDDQRREWHRTRQQEFFRDRAVHKL